MTLLLDTHALLWMISDDPRLPASARRHIETTATLAWSTVSLWEIGIKLSLHRPDFRLATGWDRRIPEEMSRNGIHRIGLEPHHCAEVSILPWHHRDPFDRILVAQARCENLRILSADPAFDAYDVVRVW